MRDKVAKIFPVNILEESSMADKRSKKIKFALSLKNNEEVRTKRDLKKYFDMAEIIGYLFDGKLLQWMRDHDYPTASYLAVKEILRDYNKKRIAVRNLSLGDEKNFTQRRRVVGYRQACRKAAFN